jgi:hypothetical protein
MPIWHPFLDTGDESEKWIENWSISVRKVLNLSERLVAGKTVLTKSKGLLTIKFLAPALPKYLRPNMPSANETI